MNLLLLACGGGSMSNGDALIILGMLGLVVLVPLAAIVFVVWGITRLARLGTRSLAQDAERDEAEAELRQWLDTQPQPQQP